MSDDGDGTRGHQDDGREQGGGKARYHIAMVMIPLAWNTTVNVPSVHGLLPAGRAGAGRFRQPLAVSREVGLYLHPLARGLAY